jgi:hypothetical protein
MILLDSLRVEPVVQNPFKAVGIGNCLSVEVFTMSITRFR